MRQVLPHYIVLIVPVTVVLGMNIGGVWCFLAVFLTLGVVPILELILPADTSTHTATEIEVLEKKFSFRMLTWIWVPIQIMVQIYVLVLVQLHTLTAVEIVGSCVSLGVLSGAIGITISHELMHRSSSFERTLGDVLLLSVCYMHFRIEHVAGHHNRVATADDPATARRDESFYQFLPRVLWQSVRSSLHIESRRLKACGTSFVSLQNRMLRYLFLELLLLLMIFVLCGGAVLVFFLFHCFIAISLLEMINYLEHYGLTRTRRSDGSFERVSEKHSWEASARITNYLLFKLQRHADHHLYPMRRYQALQYTQPAPQMPTGYAGMLVLALLWPLFRRVMNVRLDALIQGTTIAAGATTIQP